MNIATITGVCIGMYCVGVFESHVAVHANLKQMSAFWSPRKTMQDG